MDYSIYTVLGILFVVYLFITIYNKKQSRRRRDKKFMDEYGRHRKKEEDKKE